MNIFHLTVSSYLLKKKLNLMKYLTKFIKLITNYKILFKMKTTKKNHFKQTSHSSNF